MAYYVKGYQSNDHRTDGAGNTNGPVLRGFADQSADKHMYGIADEKHKAETDNNQYDDFF
jgi:hypothetical protein